MEKTHDSPQGQEYKAEIGQILDELRKMWRGDEEVKLSLRKKLIEAVDKAKEQRNEDELKQLKGLPPAINNDCLENIIEILGQTKEGFSNASTKNSKRLFGRKGLLELLEKKRDTAIRLIRNNESFDEKFIGSETLKKKGTTPWSMWTRKKKDPATEPIDITPAKTPRARII